MSLDDNVLEGFSKLNREARYLKLVEIGALDFDDVNFLQQGAIKDQVLADKLIENVIGYFQLPLGVATNFCIDGEDYVIPMAVEETSIIAAVSKNAKWIRKSGKITTHTEGNLIIGQIQCAKVNDFALFEQKIFENKQFLIEMANQDVAENMVKRGGGVVDLTTRKIQRPDGDTMAVIHLYMNCKDAMGANLINQVLEYLKTPVENLTGETVTMCILSNLNDTKITHAKVSINDVPKELGSKIEEASFFAEIDPYRAATHNKGVMNGIDPILIATGNDWRAVEAGVHAYAAQSGSYSAITKWRYCKATKVLIGEFKAPLVVGIVGGVTSVHPTAKMALRMMRIDSADKLSRIIAAVGLVQNLGALRALCTEGIIQGHMKLHIDNLLLASEAKDDEIEVLKQKLENWLEVNKRISLKHVDKFLREIREDKLVL